MRKLLLGSIALTAFSVSMIVFQLSCKKTVEAQQVGYTLPPATTNVLGGVIVGSGLSVTSNGTLSVTSPGSGLVQQNLILYVKNFTTNNSYEYWLANVDGSNQRMVNISAANLTLRSEAKLSADATKVIFTAKDNGSANLDNIYSVSIAGGTPNKIIDGSPNFRTYLNGVY